MPHFVNGFYTITLGSKCAAGSLLALFGGTGQTAASTSYYQVLLLSMRKHLKLTLTYNNKSCALSSCLYTVKFELIVAVSTLDVLLCSLVDRYRCFGRVRCFHIWISVGPDTIVSVDWHNKPRINNLALVFVFTVRPVLLPFSFGDRPLNPGQIITVPCGVIEGDRPISLHWTFNGNPITPRMGVTVVNLGERSVILSISSVQAAHAGHYMCTAKNFAGTDHRSAELVVKGTHLLLFPDTLVF